MTNWTEKAREQIEAKVARLEKLGVSPEIIARERARIDEVAKILEAGSRAKDEKTIAEFIAAHPGFEQHPEDPELWVSITPINQAQIDAWNKAENEDRICLEAARGATSAGDSVMTPSGAVFERLQVSVSANDGFFADAPARIWKRVITGNHGDKPERDFGATTIVDWLLQ